MGAIKSLESFFGLNDEAWQRHANPWSVWTRMIVLPLFALSVWSRVWIGWYSLLLVGLIIVWTFINPRFFRKPRTTKTWASKAVMGERVWLNHDKIPLLRHHSKAIVILNSITALGLPFLIWGLYVMHFWMVMMGLVIVLFGKMWFLDRMVWVFEDMKSSSKIYQSWEY